MPVLITTPFPTLEETAAAYGMPVEEARKIEKMALDSLPESASNQRPEVSALRRYGKMKREDSDARCRS